MAITRTKKEEISNKLNDALKNSETVAFVSFTGLDVEENNVLRKSLKQNDTDYFVVKKTLLKRAMDTIDLPGDQPDLGDGMVALAFGSDQMAPAREIFEFSKTRKDTITILGGIFEGSFKNREDMLEIATIPSMDTLRGMFANIVNSPVARFAVALGQVTEKKS